MVPIDFGRAFTDGACFTDPDRRDVQQVELRDAGILPVSTGALVAADPALLGSPGMVVALDGRAPTGPATVQASVMRWLDASGRPGQSRVVAAVRLRFDGAPAPADDWKRAVVEGGEGPAAIGVDSGMAAVFDRAIISRTTPADVLAAVERDHRPDTARVVAVAPDTALVVSASGPGDGTYPLWWGRRGDRIVELIADFGLYRYLDTSDFVVPLELLPAHGPVLTPELAAAGVSIARLDDDRVAAIEALKERKRTAFGGTDGPEIGEVALAVSVSGPSAQTAEVELVDAEGERVMYPDEGAVMSDGSRYWNRHPELERARALRVTVSRQVPMAPC
jgi:hypothetical protein